MVRVTYMRPLLEQAAIDTNLNSELRSAIKWALTTLDCQQMELVRAHRQLVDMEELSQRVAKLEEQVDAGRYS
jgi:hypothetical protein